MTTPHPYPGAAPATRSNLRLRILTAAVGLPLVAVMIIAGGLPFALAAAAIAFLATAEFTHGWLMPSMPLREVFRQPQNLLTPPVAAAGVYWEEAFLPFALFFAAVLLVLGFAPRAPFGPRKPYRVQAGALLYIGALLATLVLLREGQDGREWVFLAILATFAVDTGAYAVGRAIGRHKMAPAISPGKTWEGAAGGYLAGFAAVFALNYALGLDVPASTLIHLAPVLPVAAILGDLLESWLKRRMRVKDASGLLPGHGGFLDRLDSILLVVPLVYAFVQLRID